LRVAHTAFRNGTITKESQLSKRKRKIDERKVNLEKGKRTSK